MRQWQPPIVPAATSAWRRLAFGAMVTGVGLVAPLSSLNSQAEPVTRPISLEARGFLATPQSPQDYVIGPLDKLGVKVFKVPDLSMDAIQVDATGQIDLPLIGTVTAAGKTTRELAKEISDRLEDHYLQSPQVSVVVEDSASRKITIEGEVKSPGIFSMKGRITLMQALAMAGGLADNANTHKVAIIRQVDGVRKVAMADYQNIRNARAPDPEIEGDDVIVVDGSSGKMTWSFMLKSLPLFSLLAITR